MKFKVRKTTLGQANRGHTSMKANCYYKGTTPCWSIDFTTAHIFPKTYTIITLNRKSIAVRMAEYLESISWNEDGDPEMMFCRYLAENNEYDLIDKVKSV